MRFLLVAMLVVLSSPLIAVVRAVDDADAAVAARLADMGTDVLRDRNATAAQYKACIALLKAAAKLNPEDERYPRLMVEASIGIGDPEGALAALRQYLRLVPDDQGAQLQMIQLQMGKMETLDKKLEYTQQLLEAGDRVPTDVRSAVAVTAARLLYEQDRPGQAAKLLDQAIRFNPRNGEALRMRYQHAQDDMSPFQRVKLLVEMIKSNPLQPEVVAELSSRLAEYGLVKPSLEWYFQAIRLYQKTGQSVPLDLAVEFGAEQFLADRFVEADGMGIRLLQADKYDIDALYLRLLCARNTPSQDDDRAMRNLARKTLLAKLTDARDHAIKPPTTQPTTAPIGPVADEPEAPRVQIDPVTGLPRPPAEETVEMTAASLPDLTEALAKMAGQEDSAAKAELTAAIGDLLWYSLYFDPKPEVIDPLLAAMAKLVPADDVVLVRMQGWAFAQANKPEEAKVKLSAIADRDPLAAVGLIKLTPPTDAESKTRGRKLLTDHPSGMLAAFLKDALRDRAIAVVAREDAAMVMEVLNNFPIKFFDIIDNPKDFYGITGEPLVGQFDYRQPMLVKVTISNLSQYDITIGADGVIRNDLWLDAQVRGVANQTFPGTAYDRMTGALVLRPGAMVSRVIRIDTGALGKILTDNPTQPHDIQLTVLTNPVSTEKGVIPGVGGLKTQVRKTMSREGFAITADRSVNSMLENLVSGKKGRIANMDLIAAYMTDRKDERIAKLAPLFEQKLIAVKVDPSPTVRSWAQYTLAGLAATPAKSQQVQEMGRSADWQARLLAAIRSWELGPESRKALFGELANDAEPAVKEYVAAYTESAEPPTTGPVKDPMK